LVHKALTYSDRGLGPLIGWQLISAAQLYGVEKQDLDQDFRFRGR
jgi:hypothetical protein